MRNFDNPEYAESLETIKIIIDGDACSVIEKTEGIAKRFGIETHIFCDTKRIIDSDYSDIHIVDYGNDAVDFAILNNCNRNDIVITNDGGLAAMVLAKHGYPINCKGYWYKQNDIMTTLTRRHIRNSEQQKSHRTKCKGIIKDIPYQTTGFGNELIKLIKKVSTKTQRHNSYTSKNSCNSNVKNLRRVE